jgi:FAD/FMN-containing dehydrogenase
MEIEMAAGHEAETALDGWLTEVLESDFVVDAFMGQSSEDLKSIWGLREGITESIALTNEVRKYDTSVAVKDIVPFLTEAVKLFDSLNLSCELYLFGHFGDGSPHLNVVRSETADHEMFLRECDRFEAALYPLIKKWGGSASSEHGVGLLKKSWVEFSRSPQELELFRAIKRAFDPNQLLNPGKIFSVE